MTYYFFEKIWKKLKKRCLFQVFFDLMRAIAARKAQENQGEASERKKEAKCCTLL